MAFVLFILACLAVSVRGAVVNSQAFDPLYFVEPWTEGVCQTGLYQTPIDIPAKHLSPVPEDWVTRIEMPRVQNPSVINTGSALKVEWDSLLVDNFNLPTVYAGGDKISAILLDPSIKPEYTLRMQPIQFHFHAVSEHSVGGVLFPAELHIVTLIKEGAPPEWGCDAVWDGGAPVLENCTAVFGVMYKIGSTTPDYITQFLDDMPEVAGDNVTLTASKTFDMSSLLPEDRSYYTYYGSLTTPACNEGLRWHVLKEPLEISYDTLTKFKSQMANTLNALGSDSKLGFRTNNRNLQPLNGREIFYHQDPGFVTDEGEIAQQMLAAWQNGGASVRVCWLFVALVAVVMLLFAGH